MFHLLFLKELLLIHPIQRLQLELHYHQFDMDIKNILSESLNEKILGPVNAPIYRVRRKYRQRLLIRSKKGSNIQKRLSEVLITYKLPKEIKLTVDVDPITFN